MLSTVKSITKFKEFNWHKKKESMFTKRGGEGYILLQKLMANKSLEALKAKGTMSIRMLNKIVSNVYMSCILKDRSEDGPVMIEMIYSEIYNKYASKDAAERKFGDLICSLFRFRKGKRKMFLRFIGAGEKIGVTNYSKYSLKMFLSMNHYMFNAKVGISVHTDEYSDNILVPAVRATECLKEKVEPFLDKFEVMRLHAWVDKNCVPDCKKINQNGMINMDKFLLTVIEAYELSLIHI